MKVFILFVEMFLFKEYTNDTISFGNEAIFVELKKVKSKKRVEIPSKDLYFNPFTTIPIGYIRHTPLLISVYPIVIKGLRCQGQNHEPARMTFLLSFVK